MTRSLTRRLAVLSAVLCLVLTVVALGAAAKHSQFESVSHDTSFLAQSVKMVSGNQAALIAVPVAPIFEPVSMPCKIMVLPTTALRECFCTYSLPLLV